MRTIILALLIGLGAGAGLEWRRAADAPRPGADPAWSAFHYELLDDAPGGDFDLTATATRSGNAGGQAACRLLLGYRDRENYAVVTLRDGEARLAEVESGLYLPRGRAAFDGPVAADGEDAVRLQWRRPYLTVLLDGTAVLRAALPALPRGRTGVGQAGGPLTLGRPTLQPAAPVVLADDFMRNPRDASPWESPTPEAWEVRSHDNPSRSANAFVYQARSRTGAVALVGSPHWDAYRVGVSLHGPVGGVGGLVFHARAPDDCFLFRWGSRPLGLDKDSWDPETVPPGIDRLQLVRRTPAGDTVLAETEGGCRPFQWHRLEVVAADGAATCYVDGRPVFAHRDPRLHGGRAGLVARGLEEVEFDDFLVRSYQGRLPATPPLDTRTTQANGADVSSGGSEPGTADRLLYGRSDWRSYVLQARIALPAADDAADGVPLSLYAAYRDPLDCVRIDLDRSAGAPRLQIRRIEDASGTGRLLAERDLPADLPADLPVSVALDRGILTVTLADAPALTACLDENAQGRCGFGGAWVGGVREVSLEPIEPPVPMASVNQVFDEEKLMKVWSGFAGDWKPSSRSSDAYDEIYWHRCLFYGDMELELPLPDPLDPGAGREVALSLAKPLVVEPGQTHNGYTLRYLPDAEGGPRLSLVRAGEEAAGTDLPTDGAPRRLRLRQADRFVLAYVDDERVLTYEDTAPVRGRKMAWASKGISIDRGGIRVYSRTLRNYLFNRAPVDWRIGAGVWEVTNRWECDARWNFWAGMPGRLAKLRADAQESFLSDEAEWKAANLRRQFALLPGADGDLDSLDKHAVLWHKQGFDGDMMADVYVGQMMDNSRGGGGYQRYVRDFDITICADGENLDSGYSCIFGGWGNRRSAIVRAGEVVAASDVQLPLSGSHRRWVRLHVEKRGNEIRFDAYTETHPGRPEQHPLSLTFADPDPLPGDRVAIWSYDNGILITRARLSAERVTPAEDPTATHPARLQSVYVEAPKADADKVEVEVEAD